MDSARCVPEMSRQRSFCLVIVLNATLTGHFHWPKCNAKDCYGGSTEESQPEPQGSCGSVSKPQFVDKVLVKPQLPTAWWVPLCAITWTYSVWELHPGCPRIPQPDRLVALNKCALLVRSLGQMTDEKVTLRHILGPGGRGRAVLFGRGKFGLSKDEQGLAASS